MSSVISTSSIPKGSQSEPSTQRTSVRPTRKCSVKSLRPARCYPAASVESHALQQNKLAKKPRFFGCLSSSMSCGPCIWLMPRTCASRTGVPPVVSSREFAIFFAPSTCAPYKSESDVSLRPTWFPFWMPATGEWRSYPLLGRYPAGGALAYG